jgi:hypothetical protein
MTLAKGGRLQKRVACKSGTLVTPQKSRHANTAGTSAIEVKRNASKRSEANKSSESQQPGKSTIASSASLAETTGHQGRYHFHFHYQFFNIFLPTVVRLLQYLHLTDNPTFLFSLLRRWFGKSSLIRIAFECHDCFISPSFLTV